MKEKLDKLIIQQKKVFNESFRKHKDVWQGLYSFGKAYTKELDDLFAKSKKKVS